MKKAIWFSRHKPTAEQRQYPATGKRGSPVSLFSFQVTRT